MVSGDCLSLSPLLLTLNQPTFSISPTLKSSVLSRRTSVNPCFGYCFLRLRSKWNRRYSFVVSSTLLNDVGAASLVTAGAFTLVRSFDVLTEKNLIEQKLSRKLVHVLSGFLFMVSWPIFSTSTNARYLAATVPVLNCIRLLVYGLSLAKDEGLVKSVSREGKPEELLRGPLYYVMVLIFCTLIFWRESPVGIISLSMMSGGDGFADIMGRRFGSVKLPYNNGKSWVGTICMFLFGFSFSMVMIYYFNALGYFQLDWRWTAERVALISLVATIVESLPITELIDDNISVPLSSMLTAILLMGYQAQ